MKNKNFLLVMLLTSPLFFSACKNGDAKQNSETAGKKTEKDSAMHASIYTASMVDNIKDPACGMPVTAGIGDTAHYKNHVIGFCSKECKATFLQNPEQFITQLQLKTQ